MLYLEKYWQEGFKAGENFIKQCPYAGNSIEARNWRNGWLEGAAKTLGLDDGSEHENQGAQLESTS